MGMTYASAFTALRVHFVPKVNVIAERHKFRQREQRHDENILQYVAALRDMASLFAFGDKEDKMLRDQIVDKVYSSRICEHLLLEADLTFVRAIQVAIQVENAMANASEFVNPAELPVQRLHVRKKEMNVHRGTQEKHPS